MEDNPLPIAVFSVECWSTCPSCDREHDLATDEWDTIMALPLHGGVVKAQCPTCRHEYTVQVEK